MRVSLTKTILTCLLLSAMTVATLSCTTAPTSVPVDEAAPTYVELAASHNQRIQQLSRVYSRGVIEIVWHDDDGIRRFRQGDVDLYLDLPRRTALRVGKLAETYLWLGSDDERYWFFDLTEEERVLNTGLHEDTRELSTVRPLALLDLIGMGLIRKYDETDASPVEFDTAHDAWVVPSLGGGGRVQMYFDRVTRLPKRVELLNDAGEAVSVSTIHLSRYRSVPVPGVSAAALPRMATLIDIISIGSDSVSPGEVKLALDTPTGFVDSQPFDRVFDLERLKRSLRPTRVEGE